MNSDDSSDLEKVTRILERHISPIHAKWLLRHALGERKLSPTQFTVSDVAKISKSLQRGLLLFTTESVAARALAEVSASGRASAEDVEPCTVDVCVEADVSRARTAARQLCESLRVKSFTLQKVTTIVSELARNIASYTKGGKIELEWKESPNQRIVIRATDYGPGIGNLSHVLSGNYQSKTGLGRGIIGCKRLADDFDIWTGRSGTQITAEVEP